MSTRGRCYTTLTCHTSAVVVAVVVVFVVVVFIVVAFVVVIFVVVITVSTNIRAKDVTHGGRVVLLSLTAGAGHTESIKTQM